MYIVAWDDHTGQRHERAFDDWEDAQLEAKYLQEQFDFVQVRTESER